MRAAWYQANGPAREVIHVGELDDPVAGPGEVLVRLIATGVNPIDIKRRQGARGQTVERLTVPGFDGAGVIEAVGEGVESARVGQRVWVYEGQWQRDLGTAADLIALPEHLAVPLPEGIRFVDAACLGIPALTAHRAVFADGPVNGQTILVTGGAGAVGAYAIQFAKLGGARVLTTVSDDAKADVAADAGADYVFNYKAEDVIGRVRHLPGGGGVDRIVEVEFGGNLEQSQKILKPGGVIAGYASDALPEPKVPFYPFAYVSATIHFVLVFMMPEAAKRQAIEDLDRWLSAGELRHYIARQVPLEEAASAHEALERPHVGNIVIEISPS